MVGCDGPRSRRGHRRHQLLLRQARRRGAGDCRPSQRLRHHAHDSRRATPLLSLVEFSPSLGLQLTQKRVVPAKSLSLASSDSRTIAFKVAGDRFFYTLDRDAEFVDERKAMDALQGRVAVTLPADPGPAVVTPAALASARRPPSGTMSAKALRDERKQQQQEEALRRAQRFLEFQKQQTK